MNMQMFKTAEGFKQRRPKDKTVSDDYDESEFWRQHSTTVDTTPMSKNKMQGIPITKTDFSKFGIRNSSTLK